MIWVKDQHAQAQQWLMHAHSRAQAQHWIMHAQAQAQSQLQRKRLASSVSLSPNLSMHDTMLSLSMHELLLSLSMLILDPNHPD